MSQPILYSKHLPVLLFQVIQTDNGHLILKCKTCAFSRTWLSVGACEFCFFVSKKHLDRLSGVPEIQQNIGKYGLEIPFVIEAVAWPNLSFKEVQESKWTQLNRGAAREVEVVSTEVFFRLQSRTGLLLGIQRASMKPVRAVLWPETAMFGAQLKDWDSNSALLRMVQFCAFKCYEAAYGEQFELWQATPEQEAVFVAFRKQAFAAYRTIYAGQGHPSFEGFSKEEHDQVLAQILPEK